MHLCLACNRRTTNVLDDDDLSPFLSSPNPAGGGVGGNSLNVILPNGKEMKWDLCSAYRQYLDH